MNSIPTLMLRAYRYWLTDGVWEIAAGVAMFIGGLGFLLLMNGWNIYLFIILIMLGATIQARLIRRLKEQITYPRTGYAEAQVPGGRLGGKVLSGLLVMTLLLGFFALFAGFLPDWAGHHPADQGTITLLQRLSVTVLPLVGGLLMASILFRWGHDFKLYRFYGLAGFSILVSGGIFVIAAINGLYPWGDLSVLSRDAAIYFMLMGLALLGSGLLTFRTYLRQNPAPLEEAR